MPDLDLEDPSPAQIEVSSKNSLRHAAKQPRTEDPQVLVDDETQETLQK